MSKDKAQLLTPLFLKYQADYEKNPRSRVFAPLAETYRKLGMTDKAMEILSQGIRLHPTYIMGYLGLAFCYFDLKQYNLAYNTLRPLVATSRDNIRLQKLFADICLEIGYKEEALDTYKYLLFINPRDKEVALRVTSLEKQIEDQYKPTHNPIYIPEAEFELDKSKTTSSSNLFDIDKLENRPIASVEDFDDWMALDLSREKSNQKIEDPYELWNLKKGEAIELPMMTKESEPVLLENKTFEVIEKIPQVINEMPSKTIEIDFDEEDEDEDENENLEPQVPLVTHTLVDLYCGQGHIEKALEVLEKILILNPNDQKTIEKIAEIKDLMGPEETQVEIRQDDHEYLSLSDLDEQVAPKPQLEVLKEISEEDSRKHLMDIFDQQISQIVVEEFDLEKEDEPVEKSEIVQSQNLLKSRLIEEKLTQFLKKIQKRALDYQARV